MNHVIVSESCSQMRKQARGLLAGKWKNAILISLLYTVLTSGLSSVINFVLGETLGNVIFMIYLLLVTGPLSYGYIVCLRKIAKAGGSAQASDLFVGFEKFGKLFVVNFLMGLFIFLWTLLLVVPGIIATLAYSMVYFLLTANDELEAGEALRESKKRMKGNKGKYLLLMLSFMGWYILLVGGVALVAGIIGVIGGGYMSYPADPVFETQSTVMILVTTLLGSAASIVLTPYVYMADLVFYKLLTNEQDLVSEAEGIQSQGYAENAQSRMDAQPVDTGANINQIAEPTASGEEQNPDNSEKAENNDSQADKNE